MKSDNNHGRGDVIKLKHFHRLIEIDEEKSGLFYIETRDWSIGGPSQKVEEEEFRPILLREPQNLNDVFTYPPLEGGRGVWAREKNPKH